MENDSKKRNVLKKAEQYAHLHLEKEVSEIRKSPRIEGHLELTLYEKAFIYKYPEDGYQWINEVLWNSNEKGNFFKSLPSHLLTYVGSYRNL